MAKTGGARQNAGRKPGTLNRKTVELLQGAVSEGMTPIEYMLKIMRDDMEDAKRRDWAADKASSFIHPRPAPLQRPISISIPKIETAKDIPGAVASILAAIGSGEISPSEAQSVVSIIDSQRKAMETGDLLERLERLEGLQANRPK